MSEAFEDAFNLLCGTEIGRGLSRVVYTSILLPDSVIKVEEATAQFEGHNVYQNINEWETWKYVAGENASRWFARCRFISPNGKVLIMEKTRPPAPVDFPTKLPVYFTDLKRENFGMSLAEDGKTESFVCHDYGVLENVARYGLTTKRMITMTWDAET